jgi:two-component system nitrate/nitrite response regulator NarL
MTQVLVLGAVRVHREGLAALLEAESGADIVTAPSDDLALAGDPDVVIVDGGAPDALDLVRRVCALLPRASVLVTAAPGDEREIVAHAEAGAAGFVEAEASAGEVAATVDSLCTGDALCSPRIAGILLRRVGRARATRRLPALPELTAREREIVGLIAEGLSNKEIAQRLVIEVATVKNHVHNILEKLQVSRRTEAAARVHGDGLATAQRI